MQKAWHSLTIDDVFATFRVQYQTGRTSLECEKLRREHGPNTLPEQKPKSILSIFFRQFLSPLIYLLLIASFIALLIGDTKDAGVIFVVLILNSLVGAIQEGRAEASLAALRRLTKLKARVFRDGQTQEIDARELVPGDIYHVTSGDGIPTDGRIIEASNLQVSEASLTGESIPVVKTTLVLPEETALAERVNMVYAGTHVISGRAVVVATSTGRRNELGKIATLAGRVSHSTTNLEKKVHAFGKSIVLVAILLFFTAFIFGLLHGMKVGEILMIAISQMVSLVPEGLPVAMTIALAVGVQRMAKRRTIVRRLSAVESLGSTTVICSDKTGTLTRNEMTVVRIALPGYFGELDISGVGYEPNGSFREHVKKTEVPQDALRSDTHFSRLMRAAVCCNDSALIAPKNQQGLWQILGDPTEAALLVCAAKSGLNLEKTRAESPRNAELPFDSSFKMMATEHAESKGSVIYVKGAPESIFPRCEALDATTSCSNLETFKLIAEKMASESLRVLAFGVIENAKIDVAQGFDGLPGPLRFLGLTAQIDPPRDEVKASIESAVRAGIRPIMITGDHKSTAVAIATKLGISASDEEAMTGAEMEALSEEQRFKKLEKTTVFARVHPEQKLEIVRTLQARGHVVAMTGDGVNDAPALVQADVGVAMGITGTEVAKEAAKIIITDDNFATIVAAVAEGRLVYQNIKKLLLFLFVTSIDEVFVLLLALMVGFHPPLAAVQILWINLVSESALTFGLIMEPMEGGEMRRPPTRSDEPILDKSMISRMPLMIATSVAVTFGWFLVRTTSGADAALVQTETFTILVVCQWFNLLNCRSAEISAFSKSIFANRYLIAGLVIANLLHAAVVYWRPLGEFFHTTPISFANFFAIGITASSVLWVEEIRKYYVRRHVTN